MASRRKATGTLRVGKAQTTHTRPTHVRGIRQGNSRGNIRDQKGIVENPDDPRFATGTAERSTGINPRARSPIDPRMPNLTPA